MLKNYLTIALRNLRKHKAYTFINITGLAIGMACCLLILLFVRDELSYDRFHEKADRIVRIVSDWGDFSLPSTNPPVVRHLKSDYPEFTIAQLLANEALVTYEDRSFKEDGLLFTTPAFFNVFSFELARGNPAEALSEPLTAIMTRSAAERYFGTADPVGKTLSADNQFDVTITGVMEDPPENSHVTFDFLLSWATLDALFDFSNSNAWGNNSIYTYLLLPEGYDPATLEAQFPTFIERHAGDDWNGAELSLQPLTDIHLHSHHNMELAANGRIAYVYIFSAIALFILLIACVNFMNLATARSAGRAKEVGVRKVVGARRGQLIGQFLAESVVLSLIALVLAIGLAAAALPGFRFLSGKTLSIGILADGPVLLGVLLIALAAGVLAGSYPAFFLSAFKPVTVLKGRFATGHRGAGLRKGLVVFQFAASVVLLIGTAVVFQQLDYLRTANLGFAKEQVLTITADDEQLTSQYPAFREALLQQPGVTEVSIASEELPSELLNGNGTIIAGAPEDNDTVVPMRTVSVGHGFFETLDAEMAYGRSFSLDFATDSSAFVLNETAARMLQGRFPDQIASLEQAIGLELWNGAQRGPLIGIVQDFNMSSLHEAIEPIIFFIRQDWFDTYLVQVRTENLRETLAGLEQTWQQFYPSWPLAYRFVDAAFETTYRAEERLGQIVTVFAGLAILIACLGLFGLATFMAEQRTKEIGVRKVLGATVPGIIVLLSKDFTRLVLVAVVLAAPVAYLAMNRWLDSFAYRIELSWPIFLMAGLTALGIAWLTVSYQAVKAALANPVTSLRYE